MICRAGWPLLSWASLVLVALAVVPATAAGPAPGSLDPSWSNDGERSLEFGNEASADLALGPQGSVYSLSVLPGAGQVVVARLGPLGGLDQAFSGDGVRYLPVPKITQGAAIDVDSQGRIVVAASWFQNTTTDPPTTWVYRLLEDGSLDLSFSGDGHRAYTSPNGASVSEVEVTTQDKIVIVGADGTADVDFDLLVVRLRPSGGLDRSWNTDGRVFLAYQGDEIGRDVHVLPDGRVVVAFRTDQGAGMARFLSDGTRDPDFSDNGFDVWPSAGDPQAVSPLGSKYWVVTDGNAAFGRLMRWNSDGSRDLTIGSSGWITPDIPGAVGLDLLDLTADPVARVVYAVGGVDSGNINNLIVAFRSGGKPETTFGAGGFAEYGGEGDDSLTNIVRSASSRLLVQGDIDDAAEPVDGSRTWLARLFAVPGPLP